VIISLEQRRAIRDACDRGAWQVAYGLLPPCQGPGDETWATAAAFIEARKAAALEAQIAAWRERRHANAEARA
jgi:hypothetical protein